MYSSRPETSAAASRHASPANRRHLPPDALGACDAHEHLLLRTPTLAGEELEKIRGEIGDADWFETQGRPGLSRSLFEQLGRGHVLIVGVLLAVVFERGIEVLVGVLGPRAGLLGIGGAGGQRHQVGADVLLDRRQG